MLFFSFPLISTKTRFPCKYLGVIIKIGELFLPIPSKSLWRREILVCFLDFMGIPRYLSKMNVRLFCNFEFCQPKKGLWAGYAKKLKRLFVRSKSPFVLIFILFYTFQFLAPPSQKIKQTEKKRVTISDRIDIGFSRISVFRCVSAFFSLFKEEGRKKKRIER